MLHLWILRTVDSIGMTQALTKPCSVLAVDFRPTHMQGLKCRGFLWDVLLAMWKKTSMISMRRHVSADPSGAQQRQCGRGPEVHSVGCQHNFSETWISKGMTWQALVTTARKSLTTRFRRPHRSELEHAKGETND